MKKKLIFLLKIIIGVGLIIYVLRTIGPDWDKSKEYITNAFSSHFAKVILGVSLFSLVCLIGTYRWKMLLGAHQVYLSYPVALKLFFIGHFFSQYMPGGIAGGDIIKSYYVSTHTVERKAEAVTTVFLDRFIGILGLVGVLIVALLYNLGSIQYGKQIRFVFIFFAACIILALIFFNKRLMKRMPLLSKIYQRLPRREILARVYDAFYYYKDHKLTLLLTFLFSVCIHFILVIMAWIIGSSLGLKTAFREYMMLIPLINFVGSIPVSPVGNVGTFDSACVFFFDVYKEKAGGPGALALMIRFIYFFWGGIGLLVWLFEKAKVPKAVLEQSLAEVKKVETSH